MMVYRGLGQGGVLNHGKQCPGSVLRIVLLLHFIILRLDSTVSALGLLFKQPLSIG